MKRDFEHLVFPGRHQPVFATHGVVATSQPLATQAGIATLRRGGNAVDAALATAIALTVVDPASNGIGGDAFALVWDGERLHGLNGSGRAPAALSVEVVRQHGFDRMPDNGWLSVTIPGAPAAWRDLHARFGRLPFATLFEPAIEYVRTGYPVSPITRWHWHFAVEQTHAKLAGAEYEAFAATFAPDGAPPLVGEVWRSTDMADSLQAIAESNAASFYHGALAQRIADFAAHTGGVITTADLAAHSSTWAEPIKTSYRGYDVWEMPPNGQGLAALLALNILAASDLASLPRESVESYHLQLEAMKLAFADAQHYVGDPEHAPAPLEWLLSPEYAAQRHALIDACAGEPVAGTPPHSDTVYFCVADGDGMMVSYIQSLYDSFGSHIVVPGTGIALQNRGSGFTLRPGHANELKPGKRPFHTIIPGFLTHRGRAVGPFGVMGGHMQPQGHVQMVVNMLDYGMDPQTSLDAPRWSWWEQRYVQIEPGAAALAEGLRARGHEVEIDAEVDWAGRGQIIWRLPSGVYVAGSDGRGDGQAAGF